MTPSGQMKAFPIRGSPGPAPPPDQSLWDLHPRQRCILPRRGPSSHYVARMSSTCSERPADGGRTLPIQGPDTPWSSQHKKQEWEQGVSLEAGAHFIPAPPYLQVSITEALGPICGPMSSRAPTCQCPREKDLQYPESWGYKAPQLPQVRTTKPRGDGAGRRVETPQSGSVREAQGLPLGVLFNEGTAVGERGQGCPAPEQGVLLLASAGLSQAAREGTQRPNQHLRRRSCPDCGAIGHGMCSPGSQTQQGPHPKAKPSPRHGSKGPSRVTVAQMPRGPSLRKSSPLHLPRRPGWTSRGWAGGSTEGRDNL